jgi:hypothetical protein
MTTRPDPHTSETPQEATDGHQGASEGSSGQRETPRGQNGPQAGAESLDGEPKPRGPVDWARQQAAEREKRLDPDAVIRAAKFTAAHWHQAALDRDDIPMAHAIACIRAALRGETRADQLGLDVAVHDAFRVALDEPAPGPAATQATDGCTTACDGVTGIRGLLEHVGIDTTGRDITVAGRVVDPAPAHNAGPSVAECAANDRCWWNGEKAGER